MHKKLEDFMAAELFQEKPRKKKYVLEDGERREVTIVFADIKGFTSLSEQFDPEDIKDIVGKLLLLFERDVNQFGGYRDKFEGDLIMALFGAKIASEHDVERAVNASLKFFETLKKFNRLLSSIPEYSEVKLSLRVGINTGLVATGHIGSHRKDDFTVYGDAVNLASRMESSAPDNRIMLPSYVMQTVRDVFDFEDNGEITVKGVKEPVHTYLVKGFKPDRLPRWYRKKSTFIGREKEIGQLRSRLDECRNTLQQCRISPLPHLMGIKGEAGLGKSRLVHEFLDQQQYLIGVALAIDTKPFNLFTSMLNRFFDITLIDSSEERRRKFGQGFDKLLSSLPDTQRERLMKEKGLLQNLLDIDSDDPRLELPPGEIKPLYHNAIRQFVESYMTMVNQAGSVAVIVLEDLHWADESSMDTLKALVQLHSLERIHGGKSPLAAQYILQYRPTFKLPEMLRVRTVFSEIEMQPFTDEEIDRQIQALLEGIPLEPSTIEQLKNLSAGNPFFIEEWCNMINEMPDADMKNLPIPNSLTSLILSRIDMLDQYIRNILQKAAVIGQEFFVRILIEVEKKLDNPPEVSSVLSLLEDDDYLFRILATRYSSYFFKHVITREIAYKTLLKSNRRILHLIVAEVIEENFPDQRDVFLYRLADHYTRGKDMEKAAPYLEEAARYAKKCFDNQHALEFLETLETNCRLDDTRRFNTLAMRAEIHLHCGRWDMIDGLCDQLDEIAERTESATQTIQALEIRSHLLFFTGYHEPALDFFKKRLEIAKEHGLERERLAALANIGVYCRMKNDFDRALEYLTESLELAKKLGILYEEAKALLNIGLVYSDRYEFEDATKFTQMCSDLAEKHGFKKEMQKAVGLLGVIELDRRNHESALEKFTKALHIAQEIQDKQQIALAHGNIGNTLRLLDRPDNAIEAYMEALEIRQQLKDIRAMALSANAIAETIFWKGDTQTAIDWLDQAIEWSENWKINQCHYLFHKAKFLFDISQYESAAQYARLAREASQPYRKDLLRFEIDLLLAKIHDAKTSSKSVLEFIDEAMKSDIEQKIVAMLHEERWRSTNNDGERVEAMRLYLKLYEDTGRWEYKIAIERCRDTG